MSDLGDEIAAAGSAPARTGAAMAADKYHEMLALADLFDSSGEEMRTRARLGTVVLSDEEVVASAPLSPATYAEAEIDIRAATTGKHGLLTRSVELDADGLVVRATVLTYRWIDELQHAAYQTLGSIAGRAIGYLAPEVALGGAIVSAGLIETDSLDRDGVTAYLNDLAENNPELMDHISGGGGLLDGLQMRSLLTAGVLAGERRSLVARGGLRAVGVQPFGLDAASALRDSIGAFITETSHESGDGSGPDAEVRVTPGTGTAPSGLGDLMHTLTGTGSGVVVQEVGAGRFIAYLPGPTGAGGDGASPRVRLVSGDHSMYARQVVKAIEKAVGQQADARVMLVGAAQGGTTAAEIAADCRSSRFAIDQVVTADAPAAQVPVIPEPCRVLSLEERSDPVALLGSLINHGVANRLTVAYDGEGSKSGEAFVHGARAADASDHPDLVAEITRLRTLGFLTA